MKTLLGMIIIALTATSSSAEMKERYTKIIGPTISDFEMGIYEVTNAEYSEFLNAVARRSDPLGLYNPMMAESFWGGIVRMAEGYAPKPGYADRPVTFLSWNDAVRYVNWLHFGRPRPGYAALGASEGTSTVGAYDTSGTMDRSPPVNLRRNPGAQYWLPSRDEWIAAGFYDPATDTFLPYATRTRPAADAPGADGPTATFFDDKWALPAPHPTPVGFHGVKSAQGTYDQAGNVMEWVEDHIDENTRMALGGSLFMYENSLRREYFDGERAAEDLSTFGFRVARRIGATARPVTIGPQLLPTEKSASFAGVEDVEGLNWVTVGDPRNPPDRMYRAGAVSYTFRIARTELSNQHYARFLNDVAREADPYCLYSVSMSTGILGGIDRTGILGRYVYSPKPGWGDRPVVYISWYDAARFANYLHFGRPSTGRSEFGTTEGDHKTGAYDTRELGGCSPGDPQKAPTRRNAGARFWIPSVDEWHKAAYYDPHRYGGRYWLYPHRSDAPPHPDPPPGTSHSANYSDAGRLALGAPFYLAKVTDYAFAQSPYGALQMGGNVWEWLEDWRSKGDGTGWRCDEWTRSLKGGSFSYNFIGLHAANVDPGAPQQAYHIYGFRPAGAIDEAGWQPPRGGDLIEKWLDRIGRKEAALVGFAGGSLVSFFFGTLLLRVWSRQRNRPLDND